MSWLRRMVLSSLLHHPRRRVGTGMGSAGKGESLRHNMGDGKTWDSIYSGPTPAGSSHFDWFFGYDFLSGFLLSIVRDVAPQGYMGPPLHVLDLGCGTSDVGLGLYRDSPLPVRVSCVDRSIPAVASMNHHLDGHCVTPTHRDSHLEYIQGDVTNLHGFQSDTVALVLDKGTSDSLLRSGKKEACSMVREALRVLQPAGRLVQLTDEDPDARLPFLEEAGAGPVVTFHDLGDGDGISYYAYIATKPSCSKNKTLLQDNDNQSNIPE
ncbi:citrate synthase-lysine N-methyltransferase CSKMT, mitochondrial-like [Discoglossus pictus]